MRTFIHYSLVLVLMLWWSASAQNPHPSSPLAKDYPPAGFNPAQVVKLSPADLSKIGINVQEHRLNAGTKRPDSQEPIEQKNPGNTGRLFGSSCEEASYSYNYEAYNYGTLSNDGDENWWYFTLDNYTENVTVSLCDSYFDTYLTVWDACDGNIIDSNDDYDCYGFTGTKSLIVFDYLDPGTYYVQIQGSNSDYGDYILYISSDSGDPSIYLDPSFLSETLAPGESSMQSFLIINFGSSDLVAELSIDYLNRGNHEAMKDKSRKRNEEKTAVVPNNNPLAFERLKDELKNSILFEDNMESGMNGWSTETYEVDDIWHQTTLDYNSEMTSWWCADEMTGTYETGNAISTALISPPIDLTGVTDDVTLYFWENYDTEEDWDYCMVDVTVDGGQNWFSLRGSWGSAPSGYSNGWILTYLDLSLFTGNEIQLRFYFDTNDEVGNNYPGWLVDDVLIATGTPPTDWIFLWNTYYEVPPGWGYWVDVNFDATGLFPGFYLAHIDILSNDPVNPFVKFPVYLTVTDDGTLNNCEMANEYGMVNDPEQNGYLDEESEVWYKFTVIETLPNITVSLCGSDFNTFLEVYSDCDGTLIGTNDDYNCPSPGKESGRSTLQSQVNFPALRSGNYFVKITGVADYGYYVLNISQQDLLIPPANLSADLNEETGEVTLNWDYYSTEGFFEDFEDGVADNFVFSDTRFSVADGYLKMNGTSSNSWASTYYDAIYADFSLEFDFIRTQSDNSNASTIGAFVRSDGFISYNYPVNGYLFAFTVSGFYSAWTQLNGTEVALIPWTATTSINTDLGELNNVMINANGNMIDIYINGTFINSIIDDSFVSGYVNLCTYDINTGVNEVLWDNVWLTPNNTKALEGTEKTVQHGAIHQGTGAQCFGVALENPYNEPKSFYQESGEAGRYYAGFNIYRNQELINSTTSTTFTESLPFSGTFEYVVTAQYFWGESTGAGPVTVEWNGGTTHVINIPQGWSGLSSNIIPQNSDVTAIFQPVISDLIVLQSQTGIYWPEEEINTIGAWNTHDGYIIKVNNPVQLAISGAIEENRTLQLSAGWNLIPVLSGCAVEVAALFNGKDLTIVKEVAGWNLYWPGMGINTIGTLQPGKAYYVMMGSAGQITFPGCD